MNRRELLQLGAGIIGGLGIPGFFEEGVSLAAASDETSVLDESYLALGVTGMARAEGWFNAHWGAAVLAGYYLCKENNLGPETVAGIKRQLDAMIRLQASQFTPFPEVSAATSDTTLIEQVPTALAAAVQGGLRAHGHAVIFASLSIRALRDAPQLAQPNLIAKLCGLSDQIAKHNPEKPKVPPAYEDTQAMIEATFDALLRFKDVLGRPSVRRPNFTHMTTHTEALMNLESMGYQDLATAGQLGHRAHIDAPVPEFDPAEHPLAENHASLEEVTKKSYWESEENINRWNNKWDLNVNPNGYWVAFGHLFKVLYSYHRLIGYIEDKEKVRLCSQILLERYFNPDVQGG